MVMVRFRLWKHLISLEADRTCGNISSKAEDAERDEERFIIENHAGDQSGWYDICAFSCSVPGHFGTSCDSFTSETLC